RSSDLAGHLRAQTLGCGLEQCSSIAGAGLVQEDVNPIQQGGKVSPATRQPGQLTARYSGKSQLQQGTRQRLRKPWGLRDRREILKRFIAAGFERRPRRNRFMS